MSNFKMTSIFSTLSHRVDKKDWKKCGFFCVVIRLDKLATACGWSVRFPVGGKM
jgi:hypothetical protein